jgi:hypothetical protein
MDTENKVVRNGIKKTKVAALRSMWYLSDCMNESIWTAAALQKYI